MNVLNSIFFSCGIMGQGSNNIWFDERMYMITSSKARKVYVRQRNFETSAKSLKENHGKHVPKNVKGALNHGMRCENVAIQKLF